MNLNIKVTWPAGMWINSTADIIIEVFAKLGYNVIWDIEYQSIIKWWYTWFDINISDNSKYISKKVDIIIAFNDKNLENTVSLLKKWWYIIVNKKWSEKLVAKNSDIFSDYNLLDVEINDKYDNTYLLWVMWRLLHIDLSCILTEVDYIFWKKSAELSQKNQDIVSNMYAPSAFHAVPPSKASSIQLPEIKKIWEKQKVSFGNSMIAYWAIASDLWYFAAYPMTPASTVLTEVIKEWSVTFLQPEDELAVMNSALWASFAWKRSMVASSGWGFALMVEALSFAVQAEIWVVAVLSQRAWPSTGTPTFTENGDLPFALNCIFWVDQHHIILSPSTLEEWYVFWGLALNLADYYQCPVILLTDKQFSEWHVTVSEVEPTSVNRWKIEKNPEKNYKRFEFQDDHISPRTFPWTVDGDFITTSYEHDEFGATSEDTEVKQKMTVKRAHKLDNFFTVQKLQWFEIFYSLDHLIEGEEQKCPKKMLVVTSFNRYTAQEYVKKNPEYGIIVIKFLKPLDERLVEFLNETQVEEIIFVENNYSGQLENHLVKELKLDQIKNLKISNFRKYDLYPFYMEDFEEKFDK